MKVNFSLPRIIPQTPVRSFVVKGESILSKQKSLICQGGDIWGLQQFNGPLDLLLSLIEGQKLSISEVSLAQVTEQYLAYLSKIEERNPEEMADFLLLAARLLLIKSKMLLPQFSIEEEGPSLEKQLRLYQTFLHASRGFNKKWNDGGRAVFRLEPLRPLGRFYPPENFSLERLHEMMEKILMRLKPLPVLPQTQIDKGITMREKIGEIRLLLQSKENFSFCEILHKARSRTEMIIGFLALLELVRQKAVQLRQQSIFGEIMVEKV